MKKKPDFSCPVCGKILSENLPTTEDVIDNGLYASVDHVRIVNSHVVLECLFPHYYDEEEDETIENPHEVVIVIETEFDDKGNCTVFEILEIRPAE